MPRSRNFWRPTGERKDRAEECQRELRGRAKRAVQCNGVILLNGTNASIQNLTAESGGGKITLTGFAGFGPRSLNYNLRATAKRSAHAMPESDYFQPNLSLVGSTRRSLLSGTVNIQRIAYSSSTTPVPYSPMYPLLPQLQQLLRHGSPGHG